MSDELDKSLAELHVQANALANAIRNFFEGIAPVNHAHAHYTGIVEGYELAKRGLPLPSKEFCIPVLARTYRNTLDEPPDRPDTE